MLQNIKLFKSDWEKRKDGKWYLTGCEEATINEQFYKNVVDAKGFFESIGGAEEYKRSRTKCGLKVTMVRSISPDGNNKTVRQFDFDEATND